MQTSYVRASGAGWWTGKACSPHSLQLGPFFLLCYKRRSLNIHPQSMALPANTAASGCPRDTPPTLVSQPLSCQGSLALCPTPAEGPPVSPPCRPPSLSVSRTWCVMPGPQSQGRNQRAALENLSPASHTLRLKGNPAWSLPSKAGKHQKEGNSAWHCIFELENPALLNCRFFHLLGWTTETAAFSGRRWSAISYQSISSFTSCSS